MRKHLKLFMLVMLICCTLTNIFGNNDVQAKEVSDNPYFIINGDTVVKEGENYYNEDTGEYFVWGNQRGVDKSFSFKIRYSVSSSYFKVNGTKVSVDCSAYIGDSSLYKVSGYDNFKYTVRLVGVYARKLKFDTGGTESGTISGLKKGGKYYVEISTGQEVPGYYYLIGDGTVKS